MLYELIGIVRPGNLKEVKEIVLASSSLVLRNGGVIRSLANWGVFSLPKPLSKGKGANTGPSTLLLALDANTTTQKQSTSTTTSSTPQQQPTTQTTTHSDPNTTPGGRYLRGHYFALRYDASSGTQQELRTTLALDPRVLRVASVKLAGGGGRGMAGQWRLDGLGRYGWEGGGASSSGAGGGVGVGGEEGAAEAGRRLWRGGMGG